MKKRILSAALALALTLSSASALADDTAKVFVDGCEVVFKDQAPIIENDRMLVPVRHTMAAAGAKVKWVPEQLLVQIQSHDFWRVAEFKINETTMKSSKFRNDLMTSDTTEYTLEVPARVYNDRTLVPLRAINEAFGYETSWDHDTKTAYVTTDRKLPDLEKDRTVFLTASMEDVSAGEEFKVYFNIKNFENKEGNAITGYTGGLVYDKTKFDIVKASLMNGDVDITTASSALNVETFPEGAKFLNVTLDESACLATNGVFAEVTVKALTDEGGSFTISNKYRSIIAYDTSVLLSKNGKLTELTPITIGVDTTPLVLK